MPFVATNEAIAVRDTRTAKMDGGPLPGDTVMHAAMYDLAQLPLASTVEQGDRLRPLRIDGTLLVLDIEPDGNIPRLRTAAGYDTPMSARLRDEVEGMALSSATIRHIIDWVRENCPPEYLG